MLIMPMNVHSWNVAHCITLPPGRFLEETCNEKSDHRSLGCSADGDGSGCIRTGCVEQDAGPPDAKEGVRGRPPGRVRLCSGTSEAGEKLEDGLSGSFRLRAWSNHRHEHAP